MNPKWNKQINKEKKTNQTKQLTQPRYIIVKLMKVKNEKYGSFITCLQILWCPSLQESESEVAQSCLTLCNCRAPPSMGFSRQEYWSGLPFPSPKVCISTRKLLRYGGRYKFSKILIFIWILFKCDRKLLLGFEQRS